MLQKPVHQGRYLFPHRGNELLRVIHRLFIEGLQRDPPYVVAECNHKPGEHRPNAHAQWAGCASDELIWTNSEDKICDSMRRYHAVELKLVRCIAKTLKNEHRIPTLRIFLLLSMHVYEMNMHVYMYVPECLSACRKKE